MAPGPRPVPGIELLPPEVLLEIAFYVIALDKKASIDRPFLPDSVVTLSRSASGAPECCCDSPPGAWSRQARTCFRETPSVYSSAISLLGITPNIRRALVSTPAFWAEIPLWRPAFLPDSLNFAGLNYPLRFRAPISLCSCVLYMILPRLRYARELIATFPSFRDGVSSSQLIASAFLESGAPNMREIHLKFDPFSASAPQRMMALRMSDLQVYQVANGTFVGYGESLSVLQIACETEHFAWHLCDIVDLLQKCHSLRSLALVNSIREPHLSERMKWRSRPLFVELPNLVLFLLRTNYSIAKDAFDALFIPAGCSILFEGRANCFPRDSPAMGRNVCVEVIRDEVAFSLRTLLGSIPSVLSQRPSWSVAALDFRSGSHNVDGWPEFVRITFATSALYVRAANNPGNLAPRSSFTLRNPWISDFRVTVDERRRAFCVSHTRTLEGFLQGCSTSQLAEVTTVVLSTKGRSIWPDEAFKFLFATARNVQELIVYGTDFTESKTFRSLLSYLNQTHGQQTGLRRVRFPDWGDDESYADVGSLWNKRFSKPGQREPIRWSR